MNQPYRERLKHLLIRNEAGQEDYLGFQNRCVRKFGPAAGIFMRQLLYWVGRQHDPEGWIYKTQSEMEQETGLARRQQEKARKILCKNGVLKEDRRGVPCRLWYWVDLEALLRIMDIPHSTMNQWKRDSSDGSEQTNNKHYYSQAHITDPSCEADSTVLASENGNTAPSSEYRNSAPAREDSNNVQAITESTSETTAERSSDNYSSENSSLQLGEDHASRGLSPHQDVKFADLHKPSVDNPELSKIYNLLTDTSSASYRFYERYRRGRLSLTLSDVASAVCFELTGSHDQTELYIEPVRRVVAELGIDEAASD
jgi:hypothetical protein